jgi:hypothetical protein
MEHRDSQSQTDGQISSSSSSLEVKRSFLKDVASISTLKIRGGWGITGQQDISDELSA